MTTTEKLAEIRAKCVELLAIAEKRTHGRWLKEKGYRKGEVVLLSNEGAILEIECAVQREEHDIDFIASCAGPAESGWKATIAAIDELTKDAQWFFGQPQNCSATALSTIIKIWEETLVLSKNML